MIEEKTWGEFRKTGLLLIVNQILHVFGWAIVFNIGEDSKIISTYPARVKFRGFGGKDVEKAYKDISNYMAENAQDLKDEANS